MKVFGFLLGLFCVSNVYAATIELEKLVVTTPNRYEEDNSKTASNVSVIDRQQIETGHAQTLEDVLKGQLGIQVTDNSTAKTAVADIRGMGDAASRDVLLLVNGRRVNPVDNSTPDFLQIPVDSIERIEIIRGAGSVLYGDNAVGGVINIITRKGKEGFHGAVSSSYGSYDTFKYTQEFSGAKGPVDYYFNAQQFKTDGYRINSQLRAIDYVGRVGYTPNEKLRFDINANWHEDKYGLPAGLKDAPLAQLGRRGSDTPENYAQTTDRMVQLTTDLDPWHGQDVGHFLVDASYRNRDTYARFYDFGIDTARNIDSWGINGRYVLQAGQVFGRRLDLVAGTDYYMDDNFIESDSAFSNIRLDIAKHELGVYANGSYEALDKLFVEAGARYARAWYTFNQNDNAAIVYEKQSPDKLIGMGGLRYEYAPGSNVFANAQQTFRFLTTDDWFDMFSGLDTTLNHQHGVQYQAGVKHNFADTVQVTLTPYWIDNRQEIFTDPTLGGGFGGTGNYDRTRRVGVEFGGKTDLKKAFGISALDRLEWGATYTYQHATFGSGLYKDNFIPMVPQHQASTSITVGFWQRFDYTLSGIFVGRQYAINDVNNALPPNDPYYVFNSRLVFHKGNWEIFGEVDNMFGERYDIYVAKALTSNTKSHFPAPGRSFMGGVKVKF